MAGALEATANIPTGELAGTDSQASGGLWGGVVERGLEAMACCEAFEALPTYPASVSRPRPGPRYRLLPARGNCCGSLVIKAAKTAGAEGYESQQLAVSRTPSSHHADLRSGIVGLGVLGGWFFSTTPGECGAIVIFPACQWLFVGLSARWSLIYPSLPSLMHQAVPWVHQRHHGGVFAVRGDIT